MPGRDQNPVAAGVGGNEPQPRWAPLPDAGNCRMMARAPDASIIPNRQMPEPPPRPARPSFADEVRRPAPALSERRSDPLTGFTPEPLSGRPESRPELRGEPMPSRVTSRNEAGDTAPATPERKRRSRPRFVRRSAPLPPATTTASPASPGPSDVIGGPNLAEMAQRLEAALRRPAGDPEPRVGAPPVAPEPPPGPERAPRRASMPPPVAAPSAKSGFENLEDEMASLLGRPKTPS